MNNKFVSALLSVLFSVLFLATFAQPAVQQVQITHGKGVTMVNKLPSKVVVFDIGTLETLDRLGIKAAGIPQSVPDYIPGYTTGSYVDVGSVMKPDMEAITGLKPDLIIISGRQGRFYEVLSKIAPTLYFEIESRDYVGSFESNLSSIALIFDKQEQINSQLKQIKKKIAWVQKRTSKDQKNGLVLLQTGGHFYAYGKGSRFGFIHDVLGVKQAVDNLDPSMTGTEATDEFIAKANSDYLFIIDRDSAIKGAAAQSVTITNAMENTPAHSNHRIVNLSGNIWYLSGGGLISIEKMISEVRDGIYGKK